MVIPITHGGHTYHRQRQTDTAAMVIPITSWWSYVPSSETNRYGSYGPSNYLIVVIRTIVRDKPVRLRWIIPIPHRGYSYHRQRQTLTAAMLIPITSWWSFVPSSEKKPIRLRWIIPIHHCRHTYHRQRQTLTAAMVIPITSSWPNVPSSETNPYGSDGHSNTSSWPYVPSSEKKLVRLRGSFQYLIVVICTIVRDKPLRQRCSFQLLMVVIRTIVRDKPLRQRWSFQYLIVAIRTIVGEETGTAAIVIPIPHRGHSYHRQRQTLTAAMLIPITHGGHTYHRQRKNRYGCDGHSNNSLSPYVPSSEKKPVRLRGSFEYLIVVIRTIVRDKPIRQRWSFQ